MKVYNTYGELVTTDSEVSTMSVTLDDTLDEQEKINTNLASLIAELKKTRDKLDRLAGAMYSEFMGDIDD